jgi:hypothetical protein
MKNRKKADTYRFNGVWGMEPVLIEELERGVRYYRFKLRWRGDRDAKGWTARWLGRYERELEKKRRGRDRRAEDKAKGRRKGVDCQSENVRR